jgi:allantoate deiminase
LGVVLPIALLEALAERTLPYTIEIIGFSEEEGVRFGRPFIGSHALVGTLDEELLAATDAQGTSVREAIEQFGLNPAEIPAAALDENAVAFLEFHIEQGPVLEKLGLPLAAVDAIVGQSRLEIAFQGRANHAGTTPMDLRFDAVAAAAEWISLVENTAKTTTGLVATVGSIHTKPGAVNVIAGEALVSLDIRHRRDDVRTRALAVLLQGAQEIARRRRLSVRCTEQMNQAAVALDSALTVQIEQAMQKTGCKPHRMVSGAGHDAMILARKVPSSMIFLRTPDGVSHDPAETVAVDDVAKGIECGLHLLEQLAADAAFQKRTSRE